MADLLQIVLTTLFYVIGLGVIGLVFLWILGASLDRSSENRACRVCGCTERRACPGGCYWVDEDLCSACIGARRPPREGMFR